MSFLGSFLTFGTFLNDRSNIVFERHDQVQLPILNQNRLKIPVDDQGRVFDTSPKSDVNVGRNFGLWHAAQWKGDNVRFMRPVHRLVQEQSLVGGAQVFQLDPVSNNVKNDLVRVRRLKADFCNYFQKNLLVEPKAIVTKNAARKIIGFQKFCVKSADCNRAVLKLAIFCSSEYCCLIYFFSFFLIFFIKIFCRNSVLVWNNRNI